MSKKNEPLIPPLPEGVDPEDALRAFMQVDPKKVEEAERRERERRAKDDAAEEGRGE